MRSQAGSARTRTISSAATVPGSSCSAALRLRQETHCGQGEYAAHRDADAGVPRTDRYHLLIQQRRRRPVRTRMFLRQGDAALSKIEHDAGGYVVEVDEAGFGRQGPAPRRVHRESGIDVAAAVHRRQPGRERVRAGAQVGGPDPSAHDPAGQHVETGCHPGDHKAAGALTQPDDGGVVEPQRPLGERRQVLTVRGVVEPDTAFGLGHRIQCCRYSRCAGESRCSRCSSMWTAASCVSAITDGLESGGAPTERTS